MLIAAFIVTHRPFLDALLGDYMEGVESWGGVINRMNEVHFEQPVITPIDESMLGGILSELASSFSVAPLKHVYSIDQDGESIVATGVHERDSHVVTRRVTRRRSRR